MGKFKRIIKGCCPYCKGSEANIFNDPLFSIGFPKMNNECPNCSSKFEKEPGFFVGAMYVSYGLVVLEGILAYLLVSIFSNNPWVIISMIIVVILLLSIPNYRYSRIIWIHIFAKL